MSFRLADLLLRTAGYLLLWLVLVGGTENLLFGVATSVVAAALSLRLLPRGELRLRPVKLLSITLHFLWQSVRAGIDVAWRAFHPRLPLAPGIVIYRPELPPGTARTLFTSYTSLLPGTVPCGDEDGTVVYHCLDMTQPNADLLAAEEEWLRDAFLARAERHE
jgi:multicomponent Na+:H+ antiporter subunit E